MLFKCRKGAVCILVPVLAAGACIPVYAVPDRITTYMVESVQAPKDRYYDIKTSVTSDLSALFRRTIYDQVEFGLINAPMQWMRTDRFGDLARDSSGSQRQDYDGYELVQYAGEPILEYPAMDVSPTVEEKVQSFVGGDTDSLKLTEVVPIYISGYDEQQEKAPLAEGTEEPVYLSFVNDYPADMQFVGVLGSQKEGGSGDAGIENIKEQHDWKAVRMESTGDHLVAYMTPEDLAMANEKDAVLAVLCEEPSGGSAEEVVPTEEYVNVEVERVVGSKTVKEMTQVKVEGYAQKGTDATAVSEEKVDMNFHVQEIGQKSRNVLQEVTSYVTETKKSPVEYFGNSVREKVTQLLPDVNPDTLQLEDAVDGWVSDYDYRHGDLLVDITFPEQFSSDDKLVAVVGTYGTNDKIHAWTALQARPINSTARLTITQNILTRMEEGDINLIFLLKQEK